MRRGVAHRLDGRGRQRARDQAVRRRHRAGRRRHSRTRVDDIRRALPTGVQLRDRLRPVGAGRRPRSAASAARCARRRVRRARDPAAARQLRAALLVTLHDSAVDRARRAAAAAPGRRPEHDDARRPRHRGRSAGRCGDHHGREHPASARTLGRARRSARRARWRAAIEVAPPIAFATADRHRRLPAAVRHERHRGPHVPAARGRGDRGHGRRAGAGGDARSRRRGRVLRPPDRDTTTWRCCGC